MKAFPTLILSTILLNGCASHAISKENTHAPLITTMEVSESCTIIPPKKETESLTSAALLPIATKVVEKGINVFGSILKELGGEGENATATVSANGKVSFYKYEIDKEGIGISTPRKICLKMIRGRVLATPSETREHPVIDKIRRSASLSEQTQIDSPSSNIKKTLRKFDDKLDLYAEYAFEVSRDGSAFVFEPIIIYYGNGLNEKSSGKPVTMLFTAMFSSPVDSDEQSSSFAIDRIEPNTAVTQSTLGGLSSLYIPSPKISSSAQSRINDYTASYANWKDSKENERKIEQLIAKTKIEQKHAKEDEKRGISKQLELLEMEQKMAKEASRDAELNRELAANAAAEILKQHTPYSVIVSVSTTFDRNRWMIALGNALTDSAEAAASAAKDEYIKQHTKPTSESAATTLSNYKKALANAKYKMTLYKNFLNSLSSPTSPEDDEKLAKFEYDMIVAQQDANLAATIAGITPPFN